MADRTRADPALLRELDAGGDEPVTAAVSIRRPPGAKPDPEKITKSAQEAITRAGDQVKAKPNNVHVLPHLCVAYVDAPKRLIRELINQPEVTGAMLGGDHPDDPGSA